MVPGTGGDRGDSRGPGTMIGDVGVAIFPGDVQANACYRGTTAAGYTTARYVEAVGFDVGPSGHPYNNMLAVRFRRYRPTTEALDDDPKCLTLGAFQDWVIRSRAVVDPDVTQSLRRKRREAA